MGFRVVSKLWNIYGSAGSILIGANASVNIECQNGMMSYGK